MYSDVETYTLDEVDSRERIDRWQEILSTTHVPFAVQSPKRDHSRPFRAGMRLRRVDDITIVDTYSDLCRGRRTRRDVRTNVGEFVQLTIPLDGFRLMVPLDSRETVGLDDQVIVGPERCCSADTTVRGTSTCETPRASGRSSSRRRRSKRRRADP
jgi:hypothetical protein